MGNMQTSISVKPTIAIHMPRFTSASFLNHRSATTGEDQRSQAHRKAKQATAGHFAVKIKKVLFGRDIHQFCDGTARLSSEIEDGHGAK